MALREKSHRAREGATKKRLKGKSFRVEEEDKCSPVNSLPRRRIRAKQRSEAAGRRRGAMRKDSEERRTFRGKDKTRSGGTKSTARDAPVLEWRIRQNSSGGERNRPGGGKVEMEPSPQGRLRLLNLYCGEVLEGGKRRPNVLAENANGEKRGNERKSLHEDLKEGSTSRVAWDVAFVKGRIGRSCGAGRTRQSGQGGENAQATLDRIKGKPIRGEGLTDRIEKLARCRSLTGIE